MRPNLCRASSLILLVGLTAVTPVLASSLLLPAAAQNDPGQLALQSAINEQQLQLDQLQLEQQEAASQREQNREAQRLQENQLQIQQEAIQQQIRSHALQQTFPQP